MNDRDERVALLTPARQALLENILRARRGLTPSFAGIPKRGFHARLPLSFSQRRLWFLTRLGGSGPEYNVVSAIRLRGQLDVPALESAITQLIGRHEALRTHFPAFDGEPYQEILPDSPVSLVPATCAGEEALRQSLMTDAWTGFDLEAGPLMRLRLFQLGPAEHVLSLVMHHIISDGWTTGIIINELKDLYTAQVSGAPHRLANLPVQYGDFSEWQRSMLLGPRLSGLLNYWQFKLEGMPRVLGLPTDFARPQSQTFRGRWLNFRLDEPLTAGIEQLGVRASATPFMTLLAGFGLLLSRLARTNDLGVGVPVANRSHPDLEPLVGFFVNTLVMRLHPRPATTFLQYLRDLQRTTLDAFQHQELPFERLVEELKPERDLSRNPLIQVVFAFQQTEAMAQRMDLPGLQTSPVRLDELPVRFDIELHMWKAGASFQGAFIYSTDLFHPDTMEEWLAHFTALLRHAVAKPSDPLSSISLLSESQERARLLEWNGPNNTLPEFPIHELFEQIAEANPDAVAASHRDERVTFSALNNRAAKIARGLQDAGAAPESIVALQMARSVNMLATLLAILKVGSAYLPLDPANPAERNSAMMSDSRASILVCDCAVPPVATDVTVIDVGVLADTAGEPMPVRVAADQAAYVNFTSGSSGRPRGIVIPHRAVVRLVRNTNYVQVASGETVAHASNISFDAATFEIWGALLNRGKLAIVDRETLLSPEDYSLALQQERVDSVFMTTALFNRMVDDTPQAFARVSNALFGGEMSDPRRVAALLTTRAPKRLFHVYGPTEATTFSTAGLVSTASPRDGLVSIGRPIANTYARILDEDLSHTAVGAQGQLYVGGPGLARGYLHKAAETAAVFVPDPWSKERAARMYATGDRAKYRPDGQIDILGRIDRQVKIRGFRIEPGEIEACMREHPAVRDAAVAVKPDIRGDRQLCAFFTPRQDVRSVSNVSDAGEQLSRWTTVFDEHVYAETSTSSDPLFNTQGWLSSFDGQPIPVNHMRVWAGDIISQVLESAPQRVLEIGCGSGMLLFGIAPQCELYDALDFSQRSLDYIRERISERPGQFDNVRLNRLEAHRLEQFENAFYDAIVLNSVVQYFPSLEYLQGVIDQALQKLRPGGRFFLGDLRNFTLLPTLHSALAIHDSAADIPIASIRQKLARLQTSETELCIAPSFFAALKQQRTDIAHVRIRLQSTPHDNELSRYRFNVVLTKGSDALARVVEVQDGRDFSLRELGGMMAEGTAYRVLNARVAADNASRLLLENGSENLTAGDVRMAGPPAGLHPEEVEQMADSVGLRCEIAPASDPACFDVAFIAADELIVMPIAAEVPAADSEALATHPLRATSAGDAGTGIREFLKQKLPAYMIPLQIAELDSLPLGPTGKVDYTALLAVAVTPVTAAASALSRSSESPLEEVVCGLMADVLAVPLVKATDNFFELGGHSLLATSLAARISKATGQPLPLKLIFELPTVAALAAWLGRRLAANAGFEAPPITPVGRDRTLPASFAQRRLWFLEQMRTASTAYNMPLLLELHGHVDVRALEAALRAIVERHEALRTTFHEIDGEPYQRILPPGPAPFQELDLTGLIPEEQSARRDAVIKDLLAKHFDLTSDLMLSVTLLKMNSSEYFLAGAFHHISSDGWSVEVFVRELTGLYRAFLNNEPNPLQPLPVQYADFAVWQRDWLQGEPLALHLAAWRRQLRHAEPLLLPADHERSESGPARGGSHTFSVPGAVAGALRAITHKQGATLFMTLLAAFKTLMHRYTGQDHIVLGAPIANRNREEIEGLVGFFVNSLVLCTDVSGDPAFSELLTRVRQVALDAYTHQDLPFEKLVEELHPQRFLNQNPLFQIAFALQQDKAMKPVFHLPGAEVTIFELPRIDVRFDMEVHLWDTGDMLGGQIVYNADLFEAPTIERIATHYAVLLTSIAAEPHARLSSLEYMSSVELKQLEAWS